MSFDTVALVIVGFMIVGGAMSGFTSQVGQIAAGLIALAAAVPTGRFFAQPVASWLQSSLTVGVVVASVAACVAIYAFVKMIVTATVKRLFFHEATRRGVDRFLGAGVGAAKGVSIIYLTLCAGLFLEDTIEVTGRKLSLTPSHSVWADWTRKNNLFEQVQFSGVRHFVELAKSSANPKFVKNLQSDPDFLALTGDVRFQQALKSEGLKHAIETGEIQKLLQSNALVELIHDNRALRRLERLVDERDARQQKE